jgi:hypothetical protein
LKTKKILAILTLVAFMISILPMAAFAATAANAFGSKVYVTENSAVADFDDKIEFDVFVGSSDGAAALPTTIEVASLRGVTDVIYLDSDTAGTKATISIHATTGVATVTPAAGWDGWLGFEIKSSLPGATKFAARITGDVTKPDSIPDFLAGKTNVTATSANIIADTAGVYAVPMTFTTRSANNIIMSTVTNNVFANGASYAEVKAVVTAGNAPVSGATVNFSLDKSGATLGATSATTDVKGEAKVKVFATKAQTYKVTAKVDGVDAATAVNPYDATVKADETKVTFNSPGITGITAESTDNQKVARVSSGTLKFKYNFTDANGNIVTLANVGYGTTAGNFNALTDIAGAELRVVTKPSGAAISEKPAVGSDLNVAPAINADGELEIIFNKSKLDKDGDYSIRLTLANGKSVIYNFNVKKQGTITGMTLAYKSATMPAGTGNVLSVDEVKLVDAEGYATDAASVTYSIDNNKIADIHDGTKLINGLAKTKGTIELINNDTGVINVTAIDTDKKFVANATVTVEKAAASLKVTAPTYNKVGEDAKVTVQLIDLDGKAVAGAGTVAVTHNAYITSKPEGAIASVETGTTVTADFNNKGNYTFNVTSNTVGAVGVQVTAVTANGKVYTGKGTVNFGDVATAQKPLTMFIGSTNYMVGGAPAITDAAPFIQNGRTFVAVRPIGDALGATINWDAATQTVTLTKPGEVVTIVIGASTIKIDRAGVVTEYPTDAPAQIKDGRTYLPFRAIGEAMGYEVNFDAATQAVTFK